MPLVNVGVNLLFCNMELQMVQREFFNRKWFFPSSQTSYSRGSMSTNITQVRDKFSWQVNLWFIVPKWHDIELTWALSHLPQRTNFPAVSYTYEVFIF